MPLGNIMGCVAGKISKGRNSQRTSKKSLSRSYRRPGSSTGSNMDLTSEEESLFVSISFGKIHRIATLINKLDDLNVRSAGLMTPLIHACSITQGDLCSHVVRMLLKHRDCDVNARDQRGRTALMYACRNQENLDSVRILVRNDKTDTNLMDEDGWTALMHAVSLDNHEAVEVLLLFPRVACKVDVNLHNLEGSTATDVAVKYNSKTSCRLLVQSGGADVSQVHDRAKLKALLDKT